MKKLHPILHTFARYFLATVILMYAISKIMGTQFSSPPSVWDRPIGELSGFELTWFYYGYSFWYGMFIAGSQILAAFLLLFRRTTRIGIVLYLSIIVNILALDIAYEINAAIGMASVLTLIALFVFLSEFKSYYDFFINKPPLFSNTDRPKWLNKISKVKFIYIPLMILGFFVLFSTVKKNLMTKNEFYGAWKPLDENDWSRFYFQEASTFSIRGNNTNEKLYDGKYIINKKDNTIQFKTFNSKQQKEGINILNSDNTKMKTLFIMNYQFQEKKLLLQNDSLKIELLRLR